MLLRPHLFINRTQLHLVMHSRCFYLLLFRPLDHLLWTNLPYLMCVLLARRGRLLLNQLLWSKSHHFSATHLIVLLGKPAVQKFECLRTSYRIDHVDLSTLEILSVFMQLLEHAIIEQLASWGPHFLVYCEAHSDEGLEFVWVAIRDVRVLSFGNFAIEGGEISCFEWYFESAEFVD